MIPLRLAAEAPNHHEPFVVRVNSDFGNRTTTHDAHLTESDDGWLTFDGLSGPFRLSGVDPLEVDGDILLVVPGRGVANRLVRSNSRHNTLLVTERCDQLCVMCSQPPKDYHIDLFGHFETACLLSPEGATIGLSGGEPTLYKAELLSMIGRVLADRPDLHFHILTNAQHFVEADIADLQAFPHGSVVWGVPLYSDQPAVHDQIVGKQGAHKRLLQGLAILARSGASIELRTVLMSANAAHLAGLARFVVTHTPFISCWAIMQLENIGYARRDWPALFFDSSVDFHPVADAIDLVRASRVPIFLYNFPLCTVPPEYRKLAPSTISDWKRRYLALCESCQARNSCGGFFEWYPEAKGFTNLAAL